MTTSRRDIEIILEEIRPLRDKIAQNAETLAVLKRDNEETIIPILENLFETTYGNGKPGIVDRVQVIEDRHKHEIEIDKERIQARKDERTEWRKFRWAVLLTIATSIITLVVEVIIH